MLLKKGFYAEVNGKKEITSKAHRMFNRTRRRDRKNSMVTIENPLQLAVGFQFITGM